MFTTIDLFKNFIYVLGPDEQFRPFSSNLGLNVIQSFNLVFLERAQKNLIKYQSMSRQFEVKYKESFENFRRRVLNSEPDFAVEQDYFDWELAVTGVSDMKKEIERLQDFGD